MGKVLLGWELGGGFGHIGKLMPLALALKQAGHEPVLAITDLEGTRPVWDGKGIEVRGAPGLRGDMNKPRVGDQGTFADTIAGIGSFTAERLTIMGGAWNQLLSEVRPDLVICDFAPQLAMQTLRRIPTITIGTGYSVPPAGRPLPVLRFWKDPTPSEESVRNEAMILDNINAAGKKLGLAPFDYFSDLFGGDDVFVCCLPELDCYGAVRQVPAIGSIAAREMTPRTGSGRGMFAYLAPAEEMAAWLKGIAASGIGAEAYIRNLPATEFPEARRAITIHDKPVNLITTLPQKALMFHHGGMTTTETALRLGVPQLIVPTQLEQRIHGTLISTRSAGYLMQREQSRDPKFLANVLRRLAADTKVTLATRRMASTVAARITRPALDVVLDACVKYL